MSAPFRDILSVRLGNRARLIRMAARGEAAMTRAELRAELETIASQLDADARAAGRLERDRGHSE